VVYYLTYKILKIKVPDFKKFPILIFFEKEAHAVVYTTKVFSECSRPHPVGLQAPSLFF